MKKLLFILLIGFIFYSCDNEDFAHEDNYKKSHKAWLNFKAESNDSYKYIVQSSSWTGLQSETSITVLNGTVTQRYYKLVQAEEGEISEVLEEWTESEEEIGAHKETGAFGALTLDKVYEKAQQDWLQKRKGSSTYFETKNEGMISLCGYVPDNCADDCFTGIYITKIEAIK